MFCSYRLSSSKLFFQCFNYSYYSSSHSKILLFVCFSGKRRVGKDTAANLLYDITHRYRSLWVSKQSISYYPKKIYANENNIDVNDILTNDIIKEQHRLGIIKTASKGRDNDPLIWVKKTYNDIINNFNKSGKQQGICYIPDIRFKNEVEFFYNKKHQIESDILLNSYLIRIHTSDQIRKERGWIYNEDIDNHKSEKDLDSVESKYWEFEFFNDWREHLYFQYALQPLIDDITIYYRSRKHYDGE